MIRNKFFSNIIRSRNIIATSKYSTNSVDIEKIEKESTLVEVINDEEKKLKEAEIERKRNKSRLRDSDRNLLLGKNPYPEPTFWYHGTLKYQRRVYGQYGAESGVNPAICWPVKEELDDAKEYERVAYPYSIPQVVAEIKEKRLKEERDIEERQAELVKRMAKLEDWKKELANKIEKKEKEALAAKARKERLMEEVRMHFGYTVDPKDEKFKELLEKKEKEQKKADKEARKKAREEAMIAKMLSKKAAPKQEDSSSKPKEAAATKVENKEE